MTAHPAGVIRSHPARPYGRRHMSTIGDRVEHAIERRADIEQNIESETPLWQTLRKTAFWLTLTGISLYLVFPSLKSVLGSWDDVDDLAPLWLLAMFALQMAATACLWAVQRMSLHKDAWYPVISSQLASNALSKIAPGGGAVGSALQYKMLVQAGYERAPAVAGITASNLLTLGVVLALPVLAIPTIIRGGVEPKPHRGDRARPRRVQRAVRARVPCSLTTARSPGSGAASRRSATACAARRRREDTARPPAARARPHPLDARPALEGGAAGDGRPLGVRLPVAARGTRGGRLDTARVARAARVLRRAGARADPDHAGRARLRRGRPDRDAALAGVSAGAAVLATFAYRLFQYWMPLPLGLAAFGWHARRYASAD